MYKSEKLSIKSPDTDNNIHFDMASERKIEIVSSSLGGVIPLGNISPSGAGWGHYPVPKASPKRRSAYGLETWYFRTTRVFLNLTLRVQWKRCKWTCDVNQHRLSRWCSDFYFPCIKVENKVENKGQAPGDNLLLWEEFRLITRCPRRPQKGSAEETPAVFLLYCWRNPLWSYVTFRCDVSALIHREKSHLFNKLVLSSSFCNKIFN